MFAFKNHAVKEIFSEFRAKDVLNLLRPMIIKSNIIIIFKKYFVMN